VIPDISTAFKEPPDAAEQVSTGPEPLKHATERRGDEVIAASAPRCRAGT
jgi:hypothetical protein